MALVCAFLLGIALGGVPTAHLEDPAAKLSAVREKAASAAPGTAQARAIAVELEEIGRSYLDRGDNGPAIELLEEAYGFDDENGLVLAELTLAYVRAENFAFARFYLEFAERQAPKAPPEAYAYLGEVYYSLHRLEDAVLAWEQFERLEGGDPRTLRRLSRARQELSLALGQRYLQTEHFVFYSDPTVSPETVARVSESLEKGHREQAAYFGTELRGDQIVILYGGRSYFSLVSVPDWVSGVFDGKIRVSIDPDAQSDVRFDAVLVHELAHAMIRSASRDAAPGWLHEGLAQWLEGRRRTRAEIREAFRGRTVHSLSDMEGNLARKADRVAARSNYVEALGLVEFLIERRGEGAVACLVRDLGDGMPLEDALRLEAGLTSSELVAAWKAWAGL